MYQKIRAKPQLLTRMQAEKTRPNRRRRDQRLKDSFKESILRKMIQTGAGGQDSQSETRRGMEVVRMVTHETKARPMWSVIPTPLLATLGTSGNERVVSGPEVRQQEGTPCALETMA